MGSVKSLSSHLAVAVDRLQVIGAREGAIKVSDVDCLLARRAATNLGAISQGTLIAGSIIAL